MPPPPKAVSQSRAKRNRKRSLPLWGRWRGASPASAVTDEVKAAKIIDTSSVIRLAGDRRLTASPQGEAIGRAPVGVGVPDDPPFCTSP